jgi:hypothetical protein
MYYGPDCVNIRQRQNVFRDIVCYIRTVRMAGIDYQMLTIHHIFQN